MHGAEEGPEEHPQDARRTSWLRVGLLVLALAVCYANSLHAPFVFDDPFLVAERPNLRLDYSTRPLVWAAFDLNRALTGRATWSYHVFNALVHLGCGLLLQALLCRSLALAAPGLGARTRASLAFVTTLLWLCHPLQTETVTYLSQRAEALGAFFTLAVLYAFVRSTSAARRLPWQGLALLALALGFATKETVATAPLLVLLYDAVFLTQSPWAALRKRAGFYAAMALVALALAFVFIVPLLRAERISAGFKLEQFSALEYARTQPGVLLHYLRLALWPHPLCLDYAWPIARTPGDYLPQGAVILTLLGVTAVLLQRRSWIGFAGAFVFVFLAPSSSFVPIRDPAVEHRLYLPLAALILLVVVGAWWVLGRLPRVRPLAPLFATALTLTLVAATIRRNQDYSTVETIWRQALALAPHNARAHGNLGAALLEDGRTEEAIAALIQGMGLDPAAGFIQLSLGKAYLRQKDYGRAITFLKRGLGRTEDARGFGALGTALFEKGDYSGAVLYFQKGLALEPNDPGAHYRLANALGTLQRSPEAIAHFQEALRLAPEFQEARINLSALLAALERTSEALLQSELALAIQPNSALELYNHAQLLSSLARFDEALASLRAAIRTAPEMPEPYAALAEVVALKPAASLAERQEAVRMARKAHELTSASRPELRALDERGEALAGGTHAASGGNSAAVAELFDQAQRLRSEGRFEEAMEAFQEAIRLAPELPEPRVAFAETVCAQADASREELAEAVRQAARALELTPAKRPDFLGVLALAQAALGELEQAVAALDEALELPDSKANPALARQLAAQRAECLRRLGR